MQHDTCKGIFSELYCEMGSLHGLFRPHKRKNRLFGMQIKTTLKQHISCQQKKGKGDGSRQPFLRPTFIGNTTTSLDCLSTSALSLYPVVLFPLPLSRLPNSLPRSHRSLLAFMSCSLLPRPSHASVLSEHCERP